MKTFYEVQPFDLFFPYNSNILSELANLNPLWNKSKFFWSFFGTYSSTDS